MMHIRITHQYFSCCWAVLVQHQDFHCFSHCPTSWGYTGRWERHSQDRGPQLTKGMSHAIFTLYSTIKAGERKKDGDIWRYKMVNGHVKFTLKMCACVCGFHSRAIPFGNPLCHDLALHQRAIIWPSNHLIGIRYLASVFITETLKILH